MTLHKILTVTTLGTLLAAPLTGLCDETNEPQQSPMHKIAQYVDDSAITAKVKAALVDDAGLNSFEINVKTYNAKVLLSGFVNTPEEAQRAVEKAKSVAGVKAVNNSLIVKE